MINHQSWLLTLFSLTFVLSSPLPDPCAEIAGKKWILPQEARACITSFPVDPLVKANIIEVVKKTLAFHASTNYQIQAPPPFENDVHEDLHADLLRISEQEYSSDFAFHLDIYRSFKRVNDGHCGVYNYCYDSLYVTYLPLPLVLLTAKDGSQDVYIAPEAFKVASDEFKEEIEFWQQALPGQLKGQLASLSGAKVYLINGREPFFAVNENAKITGSYQSFATRQNSFFASYSRGAAGWSYTMGNFAQQVHPLVDSVELTVQRATSLSLAIWFGLEEFYLTSHHIAQITAWRRTGPMSGPVRPLERGWRSSGSRNISRRPPPVTHFQQQPAVDPRDARRQPMNVIMDGGPLTDIDLPEHLQPAMPALNESYSVAQFYMLKDNVTAVLALGSFSARNFTLFGSSLLAGLQKLKADGAQRLIVDVTNNGGGYICIAHWLHRIIIGPKKSTEPQAGLDSTTRAGPLARLIVQKIVDGGDPEELLSYNPIQWTNATHHPFSNSSDWLKPVKVTINGHKDAFSQRSAAILKTLDITMAKKDGVKTIVFGGKSDVPQEYCGTVGGQSTGFADVDTEIRSTKLKNHTLAPPDFLSNSVQGLTWRLGLGIDVPEEPEEWQAHPADVNFPLTLQTHVPSILFYVCFLSSDLKCSVNNPVAIWESLVDTQFKEPTVFRVQTS
ncbi:hypothetical protein NLJ89_g1137 [Agrocybe chaxingu]|uniref:Tail specific protease domain-containing protein n=1 Tax=Agrocybe chaxingu TaxID=84603 RepID=A0A9W8TFQ1_9AGAR|nr:hypothetical protein NLJ89_g1137 [Agrocybe chaxingu]